jgi:hypothetical protein
VPLRAELKACTNIQGSGSVAGPANTKRKGLLAFERGVALPTYLAYLFPGPMPGCPEVVMRAANMRIGDNFPGALISGESTTRCP